MSYGSPYSSTPLRGEAAYYANYDMHSPSPTPSPHHYQFYPTPAPQRPATRTHVRGVSSGFNEYRPSTAFSPRYKSTGEYATGPSPKVSSTRKQSFSKGSHHVQHHSHHHPPRRNRSSSYTYHRASYGDSDEDEVLEVDGYAYVLPAQPRERGYKNDRFYHQHHYADAPGHGTDYYYHAQAQPDKAEYTRYEDLPARSATRTGHHGRSPSHHARRPSGSAPQRPATARPSVQQKKAAPSVKATEADAKRCKIPQGYSLKNWDPQEEPIMLLGSVFDSNSLGKWVYDWTVYHHGPSTPMSDMAGELWLLLIQLSGKLKRSEEVMPQVRSQGNREMLEDFIEGGERLMDKLRHLLKKAESPMLKASKRKDPAQLGKNAGVEFVLCLFGRERELEKTERFMTAVRLWNLRFDANCEEILKRPTA